MYLSFVTGMACLLQFAYVFPHPLFDARRARRMRALSIISIAVEAGWAVSFWLAPQTGNGTLLRIVGLGLGLWQSLMALLVLAYKTVQLEAAAEKHEVSWRWCLLAG